MQSLKVEPQIELVEEVVRTTYSKMGTKPLDSIQVEVTKTIIEQPKI
jgi:uncharacterized protein YneF (UPF0154 family)